MKRSKSAKNSDPNTPELVHFLVLEQREKLRSGTLALVDALARKGRKVLFAPAHESEFIPKNNGGGLLVFQGRTHSLRPKKTLVIACTDSLDDLGWRRWMQLEQAKLPALNNSAAIRLCQAPHALQAALQFRGLPTVEASNNQSCARFWIFAQRQGLVRREQVLLHASLPSNWTNEMRQEAERMAKEAAKYTFCIWSEVLVAKTEAQLAILAVHPQPSTFPSDAPDLPQSLADILVRRNHAPLPKSCIGFRECVYIEGIGELVAKFDTGNGATACSLHADKIVEKDGYLHWSLGNVQYKQPIVGHSFAEVGHAVHRRPVVLLTVRFNGLEYKKVRFALVNRTVKSTPVLANRQFMRLAGLLVDPAEEFMVSTRPEGYCPKGAKGISSAGIVALG